MDTIDLIRSKLAATTALAAKRKEHWLATEAEREELATTLRVLERFLGDEILATLDSPPSRSIKAGTMPDYVMQALFDGPKPIAAITEIVVQKHGPDIDANNVRSAAWRMWKAGRIGKTGDNYHLIKGSAEDRSRLPLEETEPLSGNPESGSEGT